MLDGVTLVYSILRRHNHQQWRRIGFLHVTLQRIIAILLPVVVCCCCSSHKHQQQRYDTAAATFLLTPSSTRYYRRHHHHHHHHNGLSHYPSLFFSNSVISSSTLTAPTCRRKHSSAGRYYSFSLNAVPLGSSNNQNGRQQSKQPPQSRNKKREQFFTVNDLLDDYIKSRSHFKPYQVGLVWNKLGKAVQQSRNMRERRNFWVDHESSLRMLVVHTMQSVDDFDGQSTATVTHSLAKLLSLTDNSNLGRIQSLWNALLLRTAMHVKSDGLNAQDVSNLLWAYAKVDKGKTNKSLLDALANKAMLRINEFNPQDLSNTVLAFATMNYKVPSLLDAVARTAQEHVDDFNLQDLANTAWAFATLNHDAPLLFDSIARAAQKRIDNFNPQALSNVAWAFATLNQVAPLLFDAIATAAHKRIDDFNPQDLANTAWAFAKLGHKAPLLFDAIAKHAPVIIDKFNPQDLANTAWAFATLNHDAPLLFDAITRAAKERIDDFKPQDLSIMAWAFATLNHEASSLFDAIATAAHERIDDFKPQDLSNTAWAFAALNHEALSLFDSIERKAQECIDDFNPQELANTAWAFAVLNVDANSLTGGDSTFGQTLLLIEPTSLSVESLSQLHQFHLWCKERNAASSWFSDELSCRCLEAFVSQEEKSSRLQRDVVTCLETLQEVSQVQEEFCTKIGYSLDAILLYQGDMIGVEVDGPYHFVGRSQMPNGKTVLKHRQLRTLEGWKLVSIPYWEWDAICAAAFGGPTHLESKKQAYLRKLLDEALQ